MKVVVIKKETDAIMMKLFLFFIISTWTNGSFVTNFSKQYSMRSNVSTKHVFRQVQTCLFLTRVVMFQRKYNRVFKRFQMSLFWVFSLFNKYKKIKKKAIIVFSTNRALSHQV